MYSLALVAATLFVSGPAIAAFPWDNEFSANTGEALTSAQQAPPLPSPEHTASPDVDVLLHEQRVEFSAAGLRTTTDRWVYRILTKGGVERWDQASAEWSPWYESRPEVQGRVITADGAVRWLDANHLVEESSHSGSDRQLSDRKVLRGPLPAVAIGALVETRVVGREHAAYFGKGRSGHFSLAGPFPVRKTRLVLNVAKGQVLTYRTRGLSAPLEPRRATAADAAIYTFERADVPAIPRPEGFLAADVARLPQVEYTTVKSWAEVAGAYAKIVDDTIAGKNLGRAMVLTQDVMTALRASHKEPTPLQVLAALLSRLHQEVRYTGLELGAAAIVPRTPAETLERHFGDCKDKATLLVAMAAQAGIKGHVALLLAGSGPDVDSSIPGIEFFNHAIAYFPQLDIWVDATDDLSPLGELPLMSQGRFALIASATASDLVHTPKAASRVNALEQTREVFLPSLGKALFQETIRARGSVARAWRGFFQHQNEQQTRDWAKAWLQDDHDSATLDGVVLNDVKDVSVPCEVRILASQVQRGQTDWTMSTVYARVGSLFEGLPDILFQAPASSDTDNAAAAATGASRRVHDFVITPQVAKTHYIIHPPAGFAPRALAADVEVVAGSITVSRRAHTDAAGNLFVDFALDTGSGVIPAADLDAARTKLAHLRTHLDESFYFDDGAAVLEKAGDVVDALQAYRSRMVANPNDAIAHARYATALADSGFVSAARDEAKSAVQQAPELAAAYNVLGMTLEADELGRQIGPSSDIPGAIRAYQKATELDPADDLPRIRLAFLYTFNANGEHFGAGAPLDQALAGWNWLAEQRKDARFDAAAMEMLLHQEKFKAVIERARHLPSMSIEATAVELAAASLAGSPAQALRNLGGQRLSDDQRRKVISDAATSLLSMRRYSASGALTLALADGAADPVAVRNQAALRSRTKRHEDALLPLTDPRGVAQRYILALQEGRKNFSNFVAPSLRRRFAPMQTGDRDSGNAPMPLRVAGVEPQVLTDIALGALEFTVEATVQGTTLLRARAMTGERTAFVVVSEEGASFLVATRDEDIMLWLGEQTNRALDAANPRLAAQWLHLASRFAAPATPSGDLHGSAPLGQRTLLEHVGPGADVQTLRRAATALQVTAASPHLVADLQFLAEQSRVETDPILRTALDLVRCRALVLAKRTDEALSIVSQMESYVTDKRGLLEQRLGVLATDRRWSDIDAFGAKASADYPDDARLVRVRAHAMAELRNYAGATALLRSYADSHQADAGLYNDLAWFALFDDPRGQSSLADAQKAAELSQYKDPGIVHTLATVLAELGRTKEARDLVMLSLELMHSDKPSPPFYYVLGRIAEQYLLPEVARNLYDHVSPDTQSAFATSELAARRLQGLTPQRKQATRLP